MKSSANHLVYYQIKKLILILEKNFRISFLDNNKSLDNIFITKNHYALFYPLQKFVV